MRRLLLSLVCAVSLTITASALAQDDVGASHEGICCGATCCLIEGMCLGTGQQNPRNPCEVCDPGQSAAAWTTTAGCTPPDAGNTGGDPDAGSTPPPGGGGCAVGQGGGAGSAAIAGLLALVLFRRRR